MKKLLLLILILVGCTKQREMKYRVEGTVKVEKKYPPYLHFGEPDTMENIAIWYTDTFRIQNDTLFIDNSNGTSFIIPGPYRIYRLEK